MDRLIDKTPEKYIDKWSNCNNRFFGQFKCQTIFFFEVIKIQKSNLILNNDGI